MAEELPDPKELGKSFKELNKTKQGRKVLRQAMREAGMLKGGGGGEPDKEKITDEAYAKARREAAAAGKGFFAQRAAGKKAEKQASEDFQTATMGTKASYSKIFESLGFKVGKQFKKRYDKAASEEEIKKAKEKLGLDKKEKDKKEKGEEGGVKAARTGGSPSKTINTILANTIKANKSLLNIERMVRSMSPKGGKTNLSANDKYVFDPRMGGGGRYKDVTTNKMVSTKDVMESRKESLAKAISADEDPMIKVRDTLDAVMKSLGVYSNKTVQEKLDSIKSGGGDESSGPGIMDRMKVKGLKLATKAGAKVASAAGKLGKGIAGVGSKVASAVGLTKTAEKIGEVGAKAAASGDVASKVIKLVGEKSTKILGKSIAGAGILFGGWDLIKHAAKGDWVGMGLDATAIAGSTAELTGVGAAVGAPAAIAASLASVIRDGYEDIFGVPPEKDPEFKTKFNMAMEIASGWVKNKLGMDAKKEDKKSEKGAAPGDAQPAQSSAVASATAGTAQTAPPPAAAGKAPAGKASAPAASGPKFSGGGGSFGGGGASGSFGEAPKPEQPKGKGPEGSAPPMGGMAGAIAAAMAEAGMTNKFAQVALLANIKKESNFTPKDENLNYGKTSNDRIRSIFGSRAAKYSDAELEAIKKEPYKMGELMYGKDTKIGQSMGNTEEGDGFKYRGRGFIQLTGKNNYAFYGKKVGADLVSNPDLANDPTVASKIAAAYVMTSLKGKQDFEDQKSANIAVTRAIGGNLDLSKGYGAEILAKVDKYSQELGGGGGEAAAPSAAPAAPAAAPAAPAAVAAAAPAPAPAAAPAPSPAAPAAPAAGGGGEGPQLASVPSPTAGEAGGGDLLSSIKSDTSQILQNLQPILSSLGGQMSDQSSQLASAQMAAAAAPAADTSVNVSGGESKAQPPPAQNKLPIASARSSEGSFLRALAKDFAHPSAFTTVSML